MICLSIVRREDRSTLKGILLALQKYARSKGAELHGRFSEV
jgi:hypothetical protein